MGKLQRQSAPTAAQVFERLASTRRVNRYRAEQFAQLPGAPAIERTVCPATQLGDLAKCAGGLRFGADYAYVPYEALGNVSTVDLRLYF